VEHENVGSTGRYEIADGRLTVFWDRFKPDVFIAQDVQYVHKSLAAEPALELLSEVSVAGTRLAASAIRVLVPDRDYEVSLRLRSSDVPTFQQVFINNDYQSLNLPENVNTIVDLGANIGLASVYFGLKYPQAKILAVEPEITNYIEAVSNVAALGPRVQTCHGAVWTYDGWINLRTENSDGTPLHSWGVQVSEDNAGAAGQTRCYRLETLVKQAGFDAVDILKVDIEGAELELFLHEPRLWLPRVKLVIVETHDRFRPGSDAAVRAVLAADFEVLPPQGENLFFRRRSG